jgi:hypothetical protein
VFLGGRALMRLNMELEEGKEDGKKKKRRITYL